jgi:hypothetical protein
VGVGVSKKDLKWITDHLVAIKILREDSVKGSGIIRAYHTRRVVPLMAHPLLMYWMVLVTLL